MTPEEMARLHAAAFHETRAWSETEFATLLDSGNAFHVGDARAFAIGRVIADEAELLTLATDPASRRRSLGKACLNAIVHEARNRGATTLFLEVASDNAAAVALYRSAGFKTTGRRRDYYKRHDGQAADALVMRLSLN